jgi:hypothetical protein
MKDFLDRASSIYCAALRAAIHNADQAREEADKSYRKWYSTFTVNYLKERAKVYGLKGYSKLKKAELIELIMPTDEYRRVEYKAIDNEYCEAAYQAAFTRNKATEYAKVHQ